MIADRNWGQTYLAPIFMRHRVNDGVHAETISVSGKLCGVIRIVHPFPGISEVRVVSDQNHQSPRVVENSADARFGIVRLLPCASLSSGSSVDFAETHVGRLKDFD